ncbi:unnamed protein product [Strongylus vulgaris]|uniref:Peptidase C1A papain C-terminal domain-containing protein n=1 Tax=Strongylus vulgaris TaxID=40348 RepID=A0A3P7JDM6_STRVU|nr:unnamed protein product [Strongylus vulgaris]
MKNRIRIIVCTFITLLEIKITYSSSTTLRTVCHVCKPYPFYPCGRHEGQKYYAECPEYVWQRPKCRWMCQLDYPIPYKKDRVYVDYMYSLKANEKTIRKDIMRNGPVEATLEIYEDFKYYKHGIYRHSADTIIGSQSVKILGWGVENGTDYWIAANSWNTDWGEKGKSSRTEYVEITENLCHKISARLKFLSASLISPPPSSKLHSFDSSSYFAQLIYNNVITSAK